MPYFLISSGAAFEDEGLRKAMGRYADITKGRKYAKFLIAKSVPVRMGLKTAKEEELWREHEKLMVKFRKTLKSCDKTGRKPKSAKKSLVDLKFEIAKRVLSRCEFCERKCGVNRKKERGFCGLGEKSFLSSEFIHTGEEACIIPSHTFFFIGCNFYCVYCQNWTISRQIEKGKEVDGRMLAELAVKRMHMSRNINLVGGDPIPNLHTILEMLRNLEINKPIIWNSNMYMSEKTMKLLDGVIDVYLADFKYGNDECARKLSKVPDYWNVTTRNLLLARKHAEILIRHLVLPNHVDCCTSRILKWIGKNLDNRIRLNIMDQYHPEFEAFDFEVDRRVTQEEMEKAFKLARKNGITNLEP